MLFLTSLCVLSSFAISLFTTALVRKWAPRWGLIDQPAARKVHVVPTPLGGGIGIWCGVVVPVAAIQLLAWAIGNSESSDLSGFLKHWIPGDAVALAKGASTRTTTVWAILAGGTILTVMGFFDDLRNLPWQPRLLVQLLVACGVVASGARATVFVDAPWLGAVLTVLWILVLVNAFNFLDNMDALSGGIAFIASVLFAIMMLTSTSEPRWLVGGFLLVLAGSLAGFLCWNRPPAKIFMGDTGSHFVGLMLASMTVLGTFYEYGQTSTHVILAPFCVLAVPLYDFCSVLLIRLSQGRSPFHADKSHFSHRLVELGLSKPSAVLTIHLTTLTTGLGGLLLYRVAGWGTAMLIVFMILCELAIIAILETAGRQGRDRP